MIVRITQARRNEAGFTLVELLIALVIMGVAVVALVGALSTLVLSSTTHRGHSVIEASVHSYTDAVERWVGYNTSLTQDLTLNATTVHVASVSGLPTATNANGFYVTADQETMRVTAVNGGNDPTLTVQRGLGGIAAAHSTGTSIAPMLLCASGTAGAGAYDQHGNAYGSYVPPTYDHPSTVDTSITSIDYWTGTSFANYWTAGANNGGYGSTGSNGCLSFASVQCDLGGTSGLDIRTDCDPGTIRLNIHVAPVSGDTTLRGVTTDTSLVVRRGSAR